MTRERRPESRHALRAAEDVRAMHRMRERAATDPDVAALTDESPRRVMAAVDKRDRDRAIARMERAHGLEATCDAFGVSSDTVERARVDRPLKLRGAERTTTPLPRSRT